MSTGKNTKEAAVGIDDGTEGAAKPKKVKRMHAPDGQIPLEVVRTFYDPILDMVKDVVKVPKIVQNRRGDDIDVTITRVVRCRDEAIQQKYCRGTTATPIEIEEIE